VTYYLIPLLFFYALSLTSRISQQPKALFVLGALPAAVLAVFRGNVGTDTAVYLQSIELLSTEGALMNIFEPGFEYMVLSLSAMSLTPPWILSIIAAITTILFFVGWFRIDRSLTLLSCIFAIFYFDMTMNGIRYGLSFSLVLLGASYLVKAKRLEYMVLVLLASFIQVSAGLLGILLFTLHEKKWSTAIYWLGAITLLSTQFGEYIVLKVLANESLQSPSATSGVAPLIVTIATLSAWAMNRTIRTGAIGKISTLLILTLSTYAVSQYFYAGLRFQFLIFFLVALCLCCHLHSIGHRMPKSLGITLIVIGILGAGLRLRNFSDGAFDGESPFIPYHFIWEAN
jgi:EpsG family